MYTEQVNNGVEWLNQNCPDWLDRIDLDSLDIKDGTRCILGQLYGDYFSSIVNRQISGPVRRGFNVHCMDEDRDVTRIKLDMLTNTWKDKIRDLRLAV